MKRFHFSLRPVAIMRAHAELRAREALAAAIFAYVQAEEGLAAARTRLRELESVIADSRFHAFRAGDAAAFLEAHRREGVAEAEAQKRLSSARGALEASREAYIEANRQSKAIGKLEERARAAHRLAGLHEEQAELDEIAVSRAARREVAK